MRQYREWTTQELALLCEHYPVGGAPAAAKHIDRPRHAIYQKAYRLGLQRRFDGEAPQGKPNPATPIYTAEDRRRALEARDAGATLAEAAALIGCSESLVWHWDQKRKRGGQHQEPRQAKPIDLFLRGVA